MPNHRRRYAELHRCCAHRAFLHRRDKHLHGAKKAHSIILLSNEYEISPIIMECRWNYNGHDAIHFKEQDMTQTRFIGKTVLITGAGTGMGRAAALRLVAEGAQIALVGRRPDPIRQLLSEIEASGGAAIAIACDIADNEAVAATVEQTIERFGRLDAVFANAGVLGEFKPLAVTDADDFDALIATNLRGTFFTLKHCLPFLKGGSILINASWTAGGVMPGAGAYASTKGALLAMMRTFAVEQGPRNIRINAINPGIILTPMADDVIDPVFAARLAAHTPLGRNGTSEDLAGTVAWLLSEDANFVTGQEITVDGGYTIGGLRP
nr:MULTISPECIES: SDR family NAD(P)-dependent oxidoreductase [Rhizobium]